MEGPAVTTTENMERLRYPIGRFQAKAGISPDERLALIQEIAALPAELRAVVADLSPTQLDTPYRRDGWTVRQVVHHLPDSHLNSYIRFKLAVTEDQPMIKGYDEAAWAELPDGRAEDIEISLVLLEALHRRWAVFLHALDSDAYHRAFRHPEMGLVTLEASLQLYAWHGRHHLAHVTNLRRRMGW
jgi:uncharacterized damage-inducible protein DinB